MSDDWLKRKIEKEKEREYAIPLHKYVGRNFCDCPREECVAFFRDQAEFTAHLATCCHGLLDKFPTVASSVLGDTSVTTPEMRRHILEHPPLKK